MKARKPKGEAKYVLAQTQVDGVFLVGLRDTTHPY